ncbi:hypothetical protein Tco_0205381 [Tanacetum coccineum]
MDKSEHEIGRVQEIKAEGIIMVNIIPPDHVDDVTIVELNQHDDVPIILEPDLVDKDEDPLDRTLQPSTPSLTFLQNLVDPRSRATRLLYQLWSLKNP